MEKMFYILIFSGRAYMCAPTGPPRDEISEIWTSAKSPLKNKKGIPSDRSNSIIWVNKFNPFE